MRATGILLLSICLAAGCATSSGGGADDDGGGGGSIDAGPGSDAEADSDAAIVDGGGGGGDPDAAPCPAYQDRCDGVCIPTSVDPDNCGGCGVVCGDQQVCTSGGCTDSCPSGWSECGGTCVDIESDSQHCNGCDHACEDGTGCVQGVCIPSLGGDDLPMCVGGGPPVVIDPGTTSDCTAQSIFRWGICSCTDVDVSATLRVDAYDSSLGPYVPGGEGGSVGLNEVYHSSGIADLSGSLWASSPAGMNPSSDLTVVQELHAGGPFHPRITVIGGDSYVDGDIGATATIDIAGVLHQETGATVTGNVTYGSRVEESVTVPPPCECEPAQLIPVAAIAAAHATDNDNALIDLDPAALTSPSAAARLDLPCGRYYLTGIGGSYAVTIAAHGHTALFIDGSIQLSKPLTISVDPDGSLDILIAGALSTSSTLVIGSPSYPALTRLYIGGTSGFHISSSAALAAFFYAPNGLVGGSSSLEVYGGIFAGDFGNSGETEVHYDSAVLDVGGDCTPPEGCDTCQDCGNQACIDGECGMCTSDSQCCPPLICVGGACVPIVID
jgi:stigma-specific protein Stig1